MSFQNLKAFNLALLAKQGWRLQTNTNSLVYRVLKARYLPHCDFLHAELGSEPSFAWRSIMAAQDVIKSGSRWQVGDGSSVQIWLDKWLSQQTTFRVISPPHTIPADSQVCTLINAEAGEWQEDMIHHIFLPTDADAILAIPRSRVRAKDRLIWAYTARGLFTVNSAYKVALSLSSHASPCTSSNAPNHTYYWSTIWGLSLPNKIKTFAWKASRNILPTKTDLCHRGVLDEALCEACGLSEETSGHLFWDCTVAREIWEASGLPLDVRGIRYREFIDLIWHLIFVQPGRLKL